jgi:transcriptional regulator with XRE-family HTH domain
MKCFLFSPFSYSRRDLFHIEIQGVANLNFQDARLKLLAYVRNEIRNGELTERRLARLVGISQPHAHNVLKGVRTLSPQVFDLVLKYLHLSLLDLAPTEELEAQLERRRQHPRVAEIPFLAAPVGPGWPWPTEVDWRKTFPAPLSASGLPAEPRMAHLAPDPAMAETFGSYDLALLDVSQHARANISPEALYVIEREHAGSQSDAVLRKISDAHVPAGVIKARVIWLGREQDRGQLQRGRWLYDPISS